MLAPFSHHQEFRSLNKYMFKINYHNASIVVLKKITHPLGPPSLILEGDDHPTRPPSLGKRGGQGVSLGEDEGNITPIQAYKNF